MTGRAPSTGRSIGKVGVALVVATGLGAVLPVVCARLMPPDRYVYFLAFWGLLFGIGSAVAPVEQEVSRQAALAAVVGTRVGAAAMRVAAVVAAAVMVFGLVVVLPPVSARLFGPYPALAPVAAVGGVAFVAQFAVRGFLVGQQRITRYCGMVVVEALVRLVLLAAVVAAGVADVLSLALAVAAGSLAWVGFARPAIRAVDRRRDREPWLRLAARMGVLVLSAGLTSCVITGYPALVTLLAAGGVDPAVGGLFAALTVARLPLLLFGAVQAVAVPTAVRLSQDAAGRRRLRVLLVGGTVAMLALGVLGALAAAAAGPFLVALLFGPDYVVGPLTVAGLVWSSVMLAGVLLLAAVLVARQQVHRVLLVWALVCGISVAVLAWVPGGTVTRATLGLVVAPTVGLVLALVLVLGSPAPSDSGGAEAMP
jgi:O-antigen/teichoic acid export membrane protein